MTRSGENMTASDIALEAGLHSLTEVSKISGVSPQTLNNWRHHKPLLFRVVISGCALEKVHRVLFPSEQLRDYLAHPNKDQISRG